MSEKRDDFKRDFKALLAKYNADFSTEEDSSEITFYFDDELNTPHLDYTSWEEK